jgi:C4-dicarboxylate-specific signal transduction histidine kinase
MKSVIRSPQFLPFVTIDFAKVKTDKTSRERFERIKQLVLRVSGIVRQLASRIPSPDPGQWQQVQVNDVLSSTLEVARLSRTSKNAEIATEFAADLPQVSRHTRPAWTGLPESTF